MRTPNSKCCICEKPLYRRPGELARVRFVVCGEHRAEALEKHGLTKKQSSALVLGRKPGRVVLKTRKHTDAENAWMSIVMKKWCADNPDKLIERGKKMRGENHYNWKGGASQFNFAIRGLNENRKWVNSVTMRDCKCLDCGSTLDLEAHHKKPLAELITENEIKTVDQARACVALWDPSNGITLCAKCHCKEHNRKYSPIGAGRRKRAPKVRRSMAGDKNPNYKGGPVTLICKECGSEFYSKKCRAGIRKFCSRECVNENRRKKL